MSSEMKPEQLRRLQQIQLGRTIYQKLYGEQNEQLSCSIQSDEISIFGANGDLLGTYDKSYIDRLPRTKPGVFGPSLTPLPHVLTESWVRRQIKEIEQKENQK